MERSNAVFDAKNVQQFELRSVLVLSDVKSSGIV
jgi:hypothetical protein